MEKIPYFVKYSTTKKRAKLSSFLPPVPITLFHSFFLKKKTGKKKRAAKAGETRQCRDLSHPGYPQSLPRRGVCTLRPSFPRCPGSGLPVFRGQARRGGAGCAPALSTALCAAADNGSSGWNASIRRGNLREGSWLLEKKAKADVCPGCWKTWLDGCLILLYLRDIKKGGRRKGREGSIHARTRIRLLLPPHWNTAPLCTL